MSGELLHLTVLGSATPYPSTDNPCSGYLVSSGDTRIWVDAGSGTLGPLQRHVRLDELDAIWISHLHADHSADLLTAYYGALYADIHLAAPIPLYGPPGIADRLAGCADLATLAAPEAGDGGRGGRHPRPYCWQQPVLDAVQVCTRNIPATIGPGSKIFILVPLPRPHSPFTLTAMAAVILTARRHVDFGRLASTLCNAAAA